MLTNALTYDIIKTVKGNTPKEREENKMKRYSIVMMNESKKVYNSFSYHFLNEANDYFNNLTSTFYDTILLVDNHTNKILEKK